jgi:hypothetical protein
MFDRPLLAVSMFDLSRSSCFPSGLRSRWLEIMPPMVGVRQKASLELTQHQSILLRMLPRLRIAQLPACQRRTFFHQGIRALLLPAAHILSHRSERNRH